MSRAKGTTKVPTKAPTKGPTKDSKMSAEKARAAKENKKLLAILDESLPPEKVREIQASDAAFQDAMRSITRSAAQATKAEVRAVMLVANIAARMKDPGSAPPRVRPQTEQERDIERNLHEALDGYSLSSMENGERNSIADLLAPKDLSIDKSRGLEYRCYYKPVPIHGAKTQAELEVFLDEHKAHHMAIYSVERQPDGLSCFHIEDLIRLLKRESNTVSDVDLQRLTEEYWQSAGITVSGVRFTGTELLDAVQWGAAYSKLREMLADEGALDAAARRSLLKVSSALVPTQRLSTWRRWNNQMQRRMRDMWTFIGRNFVVKFVSSCACVLALWYGSIGKSRDLTEAVWHVGYENYIGLITLVICPYISSFVIEYAGPALTAAKAAVLSTLKALRIPWLLQIVGMLFEVFEALKPENIENKTLKAVATGAKFMVTTVLKKMVASGIVVAATTWSPSAVALSAGAVFTLPSLLPIAIGALLSAYIGNTSTFEPLAMQVSSGNKLGSIVTVLLAAFTTDTVCDFIGNLSTKAGTTCRKYRSSVVKGLMNVTLILGILDLLLLLGRSVDKELFKSFPKTHCEEYLERLLLSNFNKATLNADLAAKETKERATELYALNVKLQDPKLPQPSQEEVLNKEGEYKKAAEILAASNAKLQIAADEAEQKVTLGKIYTMYDKAVEEAREKGLKLDEWKMRHEFVLKYTEDKGQGSKENEELDLARGKMSKLQREYDAAKRMLEKDQPKTKFYVLGETTDELKKSKELETYQLNLISQELERIKKKTDEKLKESQAKALPMAIERIKNAAQTAKKDLDDIQLELFKQNAMLQVLEIQKQFLEQNNVTLDKQFETDLEARRNDLKALEIEAASALEASKTSNAWLKNSAETTKTPYEPPPESSPESKLREESVRQEVVRYATHIQADTNRRIEKAAQDLKDFKSAQVEAKQAAKLAKDLGMGLEVQHGRLQILNQAKSDKSTRFGRERRKELTDAIAFTSELQQQYEKAVQKADGLKAALVVKAEIANQPVKGIETETYRVDFTPKVESLAELEDYRTNVKERNNAALQNRKAAEARIAQILNDKAATQTQKLADRFAAASKETVEVANQAQDLGAELAANQEKIDILKTVNSTDDAEELKGLEMKQLDLAGNYTKAEEDLTFANKKLRRTARQAQQKYEEKEIEESMLLSPRLQKEVNQFNKNVQTRTQTRLEAARAEAARQEAARQEFKRLMDDAKKEAKDVENFDLLIVTNNGKKRILETTFPEDLARDDVLKLEAENAILQRLRPGAVNELNAANTALEAAAKKANALYEKVEPLQVTEENFEVQRTLKDFETRVTMETTKKLMSEFELAKKNAQLAAEYAQELFSAVEANAAKIRSLKSKDLSQDLEHELEILESAQTTLEEQHSIAADALYWSNESLKTAAEEANQKYEAFEKQTVQQNSTPLQFEVRHYENKMQNRAEAKIVAEKTKQVGTQIEEKQARLKVLKEAYKNENINFSAEDEKKVAEEEVLLQRLQTEFETATKQLEKYNLKSDKRFKAVGYELGKAQSSELQSTLNGYKTEVNEQVKTRINDLALLDLFKKADEEYKKALEETQKWGKDLEENQLKLEILREKNFDLSKDELQMGYNTRVDKEERKLVKAIQQAESNYKRAVEEFKKRISPRESTAQKANQKFENSKPYTLGDGGRKANLRKDLANYEAERSKEANERRSAEVAAAVTSLQDLNSAAKKVAELGRKVDMNKERLAILMRYSNHPEVFDKDDFSETRKELSINTQRYNTAVATYNLYKDIFARARKKAEFSFVEPMDAYELGQGADLKEVQEFKEKTKKAITDKFANLKAEEVRIAEEARVAKLKAEEVRIAEEAKKEKAQIKAFKIAKDTATLTAKKTEQIGKSIEMNKAKLKILQEVKKRTPLLEVDAKDFEDRELYIEKLEEEYKQAENELAKSNSKLKDLAAQNAKLKYDEIQGYAVSPVEKIQLIPELSEYKAGMSTPQAFKSFTAARAALKEAANETERLGVELDKHKLKLEILKEANNDLNAADIEKLMNKKQNEVNKLEQSLKQRYDAAVKNYEDKKDSLRVAAEKISKSPILLEKYVPGKQNTKLRQELKAYESEIREEAKFRQSADAAAQALKSAKEAATQAFKSANAAAEETKEIGQRLDTDRAMLDILLKESKHLDREYALLQIKDKRKAISENEAKFNAAVSRYSEHKIKMNEEAEGAQMSFTPLDVYNLGGAQTEQVKAEMKNFETDILTEVSVANATKAANETKTLGEELQLSQKKLQFLKTEKRNNPYNEVIVKEPIQNITKEIEKLKAAYNEAVTKLETCNRKINILNPGNKFTLLKPYDLQSHSMDLQQKYKEFANNYYHNWAQKLSSAYKELAEPLNVERGKLMNRKYELMDLNRRRTKEENDEYDEITKKVVQIDAKLQKALDDIKYQSN